MRLFIEIGGRQDANWESFHYVVNRRNSNGKAVLVIHRRLELGKSDLLSIL